MDNLDSDVLSALFSEFYPVWVDYEPHSPFRQYIGYSDHFRPIESGDDVPLYDVSIVQIEDDPILYLTQFEEIKEEI
jgi:hypothetical protein